MHVSFFSLCKPFDRSWDHLTSLGSTIFSGQSQWWHLSWKKPCQQLCRKLFSRFPIRPACCLAPSSEALRKLFPRFSPVQHAVSLPPSKILRKLFPRFPLRPARCLAPFQRSSPLAISTVSCPSSMLSPSLPATLSATYLHGFLSVQHSVSLPPSEALRKLFARFPLRPACYLASSRRSSPQPICTVSSPSSMLSRSLPAKLSLTGFLSVQDAVSLPPSKAFRKLFARFSLRPACCLAPSSEAFRKLSRSLPAQQAISTVSHPSSMLSRSLPAKLSASYFHTFLRAACCLPLSPSLPAKLSATYLHGFFSVQYAVSLPSQRTFPKLFPRFSLRPACCLAPSQRSSPQAICTVSSPSSMLSRSLPPKFPQAISTVLSRPACCRASSQHSFPSTMLSRSHPAQFPQAIFHSFVPSSMLSRSLPAQFPEAISTVFVPSSIRSRSLPAKFPQAIFHGFVPSSMLSRSLPAKFPQAISTASSHPASSLAPSQRSFPKLFPQLHPVEHPVSVPPSAISPSYFHGLSRRASGLAPSQRSFPKLFPQAISTASSRPASGLAPSQRSFPKLFPRLHPVQHPVSFPPSEVSPSYLSCFFFKRYLFN